MKIVFDRNEEAALFTTAVGSHKPRFAREKDCREKLYYRHDPLYDPSFYHGNPSYNERCRKWYYNCYRLILRRTEGPIAGCIGLHQDWEEATSTSQLTLNDDREYTGGRLCFVRSGGLYQPRRPAGALTIHDRQVVHGVSRLFEGKRYSLYVVDYCRQHDIILNDVHCLGRRKVELIMARIPAPAPPPAPGGGSGSTDDAIVIDSDSGDGAPPKAGADEAAAEAKAAKNAADGFIKNAALESQNAALREKIAAQDAELREMREKVAEFEKLTEVEVTDVDTGAVTVEHQSPREARLRVERQLNRTGDALAKTRFKVQMIKQEKDAAEAAATAARDDATAARDDATAARDDAEYEVEQQKLMTEYSVRQNEAIDRLKALAAGQGVDGAAIAEAAKIDTRINSRKLSRLHALGIGFHALGRLPPASECCGGCCCCTPRPATTKLMNICP
mmetsp:Transcript_2098/g.6319  ORF Transcript_2098/g.6319 Transcript_2098/m.6319 type:complete len:447 (+) Transcript_2098:1959-3299(+)